jgi:hypothetical protein
MSKRRRRQAFQLNLLHARPCLPAWSTLPERCRQEAVALLVELLKQQAPTSATTAGSGDDDE